MTICLRIVVIFSDYRHPSHDVHVLLDVEQAEDDPHEQASGMQEMVAREWTRHETIIMEKAQGIISELCSQSESKVFHCNAKSTIATTTSKSATCTFYTNIARSLIGYFSFLLVPSSEPGDPELQEARKKVLKWKTGTSGIGSDLGEENMDIGFSD